MKSGIEEAGRAMEEMRNSGTGYGKKGDLQDGACVFERKEFSGVDSVPGGIDRISASEKSTGRLDGHSPKGGGLERIGGGASTAVAEEIDPGILSKRLFLRSLSFTVSRALGPPVFLRAPRSRASTRFSMARDLITEIVLIIIADR